MRIPVDDLVAISEVDLSASNFSDPVLKALLIEKFPYFVDEVKKSLAQVDALESGENADMDDGNGDDSDNDDDDMSNDGSSSPSALDSEMAANSGGMGEESEAESDIASPRFRDSAHGSSPSGNVEPTSVASEMEKESRLYRILLAYYGLRSSATLLKSEHCAATFVQGVGARGLMDLLTVAISETPTTAGIGDISSLEETWLALWSRWYKIRSAHAAPKPPAEPAAEKSKSGDAAQSDADATGPMVQQMMEMGFPKEWCDVALARCAFNVEAAINFCFEHSSEMERLVAQHRASSESASGSGGNAPKVRKEEAEAVSPLLEQLSEMGFPFNWCKKALAANRNNVDAALTWILSNGEALEAEDRRDEEAKLRAAGGEVSEDSTAEGAPVEVEKTLAPNPLRVVSGQACIGEHDMMVEGLLGGGFASVGAPDCLVSSGRWYYEATLHTNGCIQIGWTDVAFSGAADRGDGVGDGAHSWAYDGWRQQKWHGQPSPWGSKWQQGDVVGCGIDVDAGTMIFSLNGKMRSVNMGVAFRAIDFARGVYPCASFNRRERLQFNLGGAPFKFPPPPGFRPILQVLSDSGSLDALPKGFGVIGMREDCLEENMGEENYSSDTRYFPRDAHPSMLRGTSSHGRSSAFAAATGSKSDALAGIKAIPDDRIYLELMLVTRSLAILQARRALLTLLAKWPADVGPFNMKLFFAATEGPTSAGSPVVPGHEESARLLDFIKLTAGLSAQFAPGAEPTATAALSDSDIIQLLDCGATGRYALGLVTDVTRSALFEALSATIRASTSFGSINYDPLVSVMLSSISSEVKQASRRQYARIPWDSSDAAITANFLQITAEAGQAWSDREVLNHPNLFLAEWMTSLMMSAIDRYADQLPEHVHDNIRQQMLEAWISSLKSPSLCVKERGATILAGIYQDILPKQCPTAISKGLEPIDEKVKTRLKAALDVLPLQRLVDLAQERILRESPNMPVCSRYLQSITELVAAAALAMNAMGGTDEALFVQDTARRLEACRRIESDLYPIDQAEYEEMVAAKIQEQKEREAAEAAKLEALAAAREAEEAAAAADATAAVASSEAETSNLAVEAEATNMEIDNSDAEEQPDITLSVIANMASEDNADASAASVGSPEHQPQSPMDLPSVDVPVEKEVEFAFQFPEPEPVFDTAMLDQSEKNVLEAASRGIMGEEDLAKWTYGHEAGILADTSTQLWSGTITEFRLKEENDDEELPQLRVGCKVIRGPNWKWRDQDGGEGKIGTVEGISPWSGVDGEGMSVRWPNDSLYTYRWGADGNFDLIHVEVDDEGNITHQYPTPKAKSDDEGTFGSEVHLGVLLHLFHSEDKVVTVEGGAEAMKVTGIMEFPDYSATVSVVGLRYADGSLCVQELQMTRGNPDMGWTLRFGTEKWQPGTKYTLRPATASPSESSGESSLQTVDNLRGEYTHHAFKNGAIVQVRGEIVVSTRYLFTMDAYNHFPTLGISEEGMTVTCLSGESRNLALGTVGFATGIHYWEVRVDQAEFGSVFIGVCEKAGPPGSQAALSSRLNRWHGWGFVNFRATYHNSTERIYGDHFNAGDTIGVRLDMEQGKLSFFVDGIKFGEHIVSDLGVAFDNVKGERHSRTLYPCIGMRKGGDRISLNGKWVSMPGVPPRQILSDVIDVSKSLHAWYLSIQSSNKGTTASVPMSPMTGVTTGAEAPAPTTTLDPSRAIQLPDSLLHSSWLEWKRWTENRYQRCPVRPRGVVVDFDTSLETCVAVSKAAGLSAPFLAGDRVRMISKCGQELNQPEEAVIVGAYRGFLWYRVETQGNEGADEGRAWAWYWSASELIELILVRRNGKDMTLLENDATDLSEYQSSPENVPFAPRSELEQRAHTDFNAFVELATRNHSTASDMQLVERLNMYCATVGVEVINLKIMDVVTPEEANVAGAQPTAAVAAAAAVTGAAPTSNSRTRSLILEGYFSTPALKSISGPEMRARCAVLRVLNGKIGRVLPVLCVEPSDSSASAIEVAHSSPTGGSSSSRSELLSTSLKLRSLRRLVFTSTKLAFWDDVLRATTTSTPLPSDEYEDPREIRVIRINRIQAQPSKLSLLPQPGARLRRSVFGQLYREMRAWNDSFFRRAYIGKGHGGQKRAFKVKFLGEGVNDYGGPYRAVFEQVVDELQMDNIELPKGELGLLPLLIPCPNRRSGTGINQDKFLLNPSCGTSLVANGPMALDLHRFLGKIIGTGVRHGLQMGLDLPSMVWRPLAGLDVSRQHLESVDVVAANNLSRVEELSAGDEAAAEVLEFLTMSTPLSDGTEVPLLPNSEKTPVTMANRDTYVRLVEKLRLTESSQQLSALKDGLASVLPMELAPLFTARELEVLICGRREVDVDLLKQCTEYSEGADESMPHVQAFWEVLREMTSEDRTSFLRFVWARSRMPNSAKDFPMNFKLQTAHDAGAQGDPDAYLPHAQTCFFALRLPTYSSKEILRAKLLYAIQNSPNMDADVRLHNAEGWADA